MIKKKFTIKVKEKIYQKREMASQRAEIWFMCNNMMVNNFYEKIFFLKLLHIAHMTIQMSNVDSFDID